MKESRRSAAGAVDIPQGPEAVTPGWLTRILRDTGALRSGEIESIDVEPLTEKGLTSGLFRLRVRYRGGSNRGPATMIAKFSGDPEEREVMRAFRTYEREVRFYQELAHRVALRTPECYYAAFDVDTADHILLLEEISQARAGDQLAGCSIDDAATAVKHIAEFHALWWESDELEEMDWLVVPQLQSMYHDLYRQNWGAFLERVGNVVPPRMRDIGEQLLDRYQDVTAPLFDAPCTIIHRDYQLDNLFFDLRGRRGTLAVFDWQWVTKGRGPYDLAFFLTLNLDPATRGKNESEMLHGYANALANAGVADYAFDRIFEDYRRGVLATFVQVAQVTGLGLFDDNLELILETVIRRLVAAVLELDCGELL